MLVLCRVFLQYSSGFPTPVVTDTRLYVELIDVNDNIPQFEGYDLSGQYPAAVTVETTQGTEVVKVTAVDVDGTSPNNEVHVLYTAQL